MQPEHRPTQLILPIAGGKGGVGKTLFTACLTRELDAAGLHCTAVDLDLGGSNLHSFFGLDNIHPGVGDYLAGHAGSLNELGVAVPATVNARFIPGEGLRPFMANIPHTGKVRLLRDLGRLDSEVVLLDLGAGSTYNTLDFFRVWGRGILLTTPEYPAIMNMMNFAKNLVMRIVAKGSQGNTFLEEIVKKMSRQSVDDEVATVPAMLEQMAAVSPERTARISRQLAAMKLDLVVNQLRQPAELKFVRSVQASLQKRLGLQVNWQGTLFDQPQARIGLQAPKGGLNLPKLGGCDVIARRISRGDVVGSEFLVDEAEQQFGRMTAG